MPELCNEVMTAIYLRPHSLRFTGADPFSISHVLGIVAPTYSARAPCTLRGEEYRTAG
jgi:hypothetical protein